MTSGKSLDVRGRVILHMRGGAANPAVLDVAFRVARVFRGELRGLFVEDEEVLSLAGLPFAQEYSLTGHRPRQLSVEVVRREMEAAFAAMQREFERLSQAARITAHLEMVRGSAANALHSALRETGILAIGEPLPPALATAVSNIPPFFPDVAGLIVASAQATRVRGPVIAVLDAGSDVPLMVDTAEKIARDAGQSVIVAFVDGDDALVSQMEQQARASIDPGTRYRLERIAEGGVAAVSRLARRNSAGLVIAHRSGPLAHDEVSAVRMASALDCPLLLLT